MRMYTTRNLNKDLYHICSNYYVKYSLLQDFINRRIDQINFVEQLKTKKDNYEIQQILAELQKISEKIRLNDERLDPDPIDIASKLRKAGRNQEAFNTIVPYLQANIDDKDAIITFGWIMYDYLKGSEENIEIYVNNLGIFNNFVMLPFEKAYLEIFSNDNQLLTLVTNYLWSIRRVVMQGELQANKVFPEFIRFCGNSSQFIEKRWNNNELSPSRLLLKELLKKLNNTNYFNFMDAIGFDWFSQCDFETSTYTNSNGELSEAKPLVEEMMRLHANKLLSCDEFVATEQRINDFIEILNIQIEKNPTYEWLPYYRTKLLIKVNRKEEALKAITSFARMKSKEYWIWDLISELVNDGEKFNCLCKALLCKAKPELIVKVQEKIIALSIEKKMFTNAKYELDELISTRMKKWGKIPQQLERWKNESWYTETNATTNRDALKEFANKADEILYRTLPFMDIYITYINEEKGVVNFAYFENNFSLKEGYFYTDSIKDERDWLIEETVKVKMVTDSKRPNLFKIHEIAPGNEAFLDNFIQRDFGIVDKGYDNPFAFVDDAYISPALVKEHGIDDYDEITYIKKKKFNKKRNKWGWMVEKILSVEKHGLIEN